MTKKTYKAQGIDIKPYLFEGQRFDLSFLTDIFTSVTSKYRGRQKNNIIDILTKETQVVLKATISDKRKSKNEVKPKCYYFLTRVYSKLY